MSDRIVIREMEIQCRIGVPDEERAEPQTLRVTIEMDVDTHLQQDRQHGQTVDYFWCIKSTPGGAGPKLIETLAEEISQMV